jgi:hypothetical protein
VQYGHAFDVIRLQDPRDVAGLGILVHGYDRRRHYLAREAFLVTKACHEIGIERLAFGKQRRSPVPARLPVGLFAADQIAFAHDADRGARLVNKRNRTDALSRRSRAMCDVGASARTEMTSQVMSSLAFIAC